MSEQNNHKANGLPKGWKWVKLGDVCQTTSGGTPSRRESKYYNGNIPWVKSGELDKGLITDTEEKISEEALRNSSAKIFPKGTLLIALYGATIGKLAILGIDAATNQAICGIYQNENINSHFLFNYLLYKKPKLVNQGIGGAQPNISQTILKDLNLPLPPKGVQHQIVSKIEELFSELDKGIEQLKTAQQQLKVYRQAVLKWAFEGKLTNENVKDGELPEMWEQVKIEDIANCLDHKRKPVNKQERGKKKGNIPYYGANGRTGWIDDYLFDEPLILVVEDETFLGRELPFSYKITGKSWVNNHAHILKPKNGTHIDFLNYQLFYYPFLPIVTGTTGRKKLTKNALINAPIAICSLEEQHAIVQEIECRLSVAEKIEETITTSLQQAQALRQGILKKAFEGKLSSK
jgi:type I restriction enzyme, S subunit